MCEPEFTKVSDFDKTSAIKRQREHLSVSCLNNRFEDAADWCAGLSDAA